MNYFTTKIKARDSFLSSGFRRSRQELSRDPGYHSKTSKYCVDMADKSNYRNDQRAEVD